MKNSPENNNKSNLNKKIKVSLSGKTKIISGNIFAKEKRRNPLLLKYSLNKLNNFDKIIAISEHTKKDILKFTNCSADKIEVI